MPHTRSHTHTAHLLGKAFRIVDLECIVRAKQGRAPGKNWYDCSGMRSEMDHTHGHDIHTNARHTHIQHILF